MSFTSLFQNVFSSRSSDDPVKITYNLGVQSLAKGDVMDAIDKFKSVCNEHSSAAYNLGLIYLNGCGQFIPDYALARKYLSLADKMGHPKAKQSACVIGLSDRKIPNEEYMQLLHYALLQYIEGKQLGNLAYLIAYDIKRNILENSLQEIYSVDRFLSYEVWCIRNFANEEVNKLYHTSSLIHYPNNYVNDWKNGEVASISDYLNTEFIPFIMSQFKNKRVRLEELGPLRLSAVNAVYQYYL